MTRRPLDSERGSPFRRDSLAPIAMYYGAPFGVVVRADGTELLRDGVPLLVDETEVRARAAEQATRLHALL